jgi:hypothetical protein
VKARGVQIVMSNSNTAFVRNSVGSAEVINITCKRSINSKNPGSKTEEVLVKF